MFDAALMAAVMLLFNVVHPHRVGVSSSKSRLTDLEALGMGEVNQDGKVISPTPATAQDSRAI